MYELHDRGESRRNILSQPLWFSSLPPSDTFLRHSFHSHRGYMACRLFTINVAT